MDRSGGQPSCEMSSARGIPGPVCCGYVTIRPMVLLEQRSPVDVLPLPPYCCDSQGLIKTLTSVARSLPDDKAYGRESKEMEFGNFSGQLKESGARRSPTPLQRLMLHKLACSNAIPQ